MLICFEGVDGSGKGTQAKFLLERLRFRGLTVELYSFPRYEETLFGKLIGDYLNGKFGYLNQNHPLLTSLLYSLDRWQSLKDLKDSIESNDVVICDRYVLSNIAHQGAKIDDAIERDYVISMIEKIEYGVLGIPCADLTFILDLPVSLAADNVLMKKARTYTDKAADIHEVDTNYLEKVYNVYLNQLSGYYQTISRVSCVKDYKQRGIGDIHDEIYTTLVKLNHPHLHGKQK